MADTTKKDGDSREDLTRLYFLYITHPTPETLDAFFQACFVNLRKTINYYVHEKRIYPSFLAPSTFAEDAFSLAVVKFWGGVHKVRNPEQIKAWLDTVGHSAVVEELLSWIRRSKKGPIRWEPFEPEAEDDAA
jgi:hypothetical protein